MPKGELKPPLFSCEGDNLLLNDLEVSRFMFHLFFFFLNSSKTDNAIEVKPSLFSIIGNDSFLL